MDLVAFEREALKMIETGGYEQAVTQVFVSHMPNDAFASDSQWRGATRS
jgi:hypothetical protein